MDEIAFAFPFVAEGLSLLRLPDDRVMDRAPGFFLPDDRGFALVRDADAGDVGR